MRAQWLKVLVSVATVLGISSQASAYVFKVQNRGTQVIELAVAYEADQFDGAPASGSRFINGLFMIEPGKTAALFTYTQALNAAWVAIRSGPQRTVWKAERLQTYDVASSNIVCKPACAVTGIPGFTGDTAVTATIYESLMTVGYGPLHLAKVFGAVLYADAELVWAPPAPVPVPVPPVVTGQVKICNQTDKHLAAAVGYFDSEQKVWVAAGWYHLDAGSCAAPLNNAKGSVYGFATDLPGRGQGGTRKVPSGTAASFCVSSNEAFTLPFTACQTPQAEDRMESFGQLVPDAQGHITWNITP